MKYSYDTYRLYTTGKIIRNVVRTRVTMKEPVDIEVLGVAVNQAILRYPYFRKRITVDSDGGYVLVDNDRPIAVIPTRNPAPPVGCEEVNEHLLYVDTEGRDIYLTISHTVAGGKGIQPLVMTCIYQYVTLKYGVDIDAPAIRKVGSELLPTELEEPDYSLLPSEEPIYRTPDYRPALFLKDYLNGFVNPFRRCEEYYVFTMPQAGFMKYARANDSSVASLLSVVFFKAVARVLPPKVRHIRSNIAQNPCGIMGIPDTHCDILSHLYVNYEREMTGYSMKKLGTITRGQMLLQSDPTVCTREIRNNLDMIEDIDSRHGLKARRKAARRHKIRLANATYNINYTGYSDWGELADYIEALVYVVDGHMLTEVSAIGDRIFMATMALVRSEKYIRAICEELDELEIEYKLEGPIAKNLPYHEFIRK